MTVRPPIFVLDREGWLYVFDTIAEAESGLEANDVEADEYAALDASGLPLRLTVAELSIRLDAGDPPARPELLRGVLAEALASEESLDALVAGARGGRDLRAERSVGAVRAASGLPS